MGGAVFSPCILTWGQTTVVIMVISSKRIYASMLCLPSLLQSGLLTLWQATVDPHLCWRLPNTGKSGSVSYGVTVSFSWSWCAWGFFFTLQQSLFPPFLWKFCIKSCLPSKLDFLVIVPVLNPQVEKSDMGPSTFTSVWELPWYYCYPVCHWLTPQYPHTSYCVLPYATYYFGIAIR